MKKRIIHKILIPALVVMLMTPFYFIQVKADTFNDNYSVTTRVDFIKGTIQNGGYYDYHSVITTTVNFKIEYTGTFRLRTDGVNPIYVTGRATAEGAELLYVSDQATYVDFQCTYCKEFKYTQSYDYRVGYSMNIYGSALEGSYADGTILQYVDGIEEQLNTISIYIDGVEASLSLIQGLMGSENVLPESYRAYNLFSYMGNLYNDNLLHVPYFKINDNAPQYLIYLSATDKPYYLSFKMANPSSYGVSALFDVVNSDTGNSVSTQHYIDYDNGYSTYTCVIHPDRTGFFTIKWNSQYYNYSQNKEIMPIYFGTLDDISNQIAVLTHLPYAVNTNLTNINNSINNQGNNIIDAIGQLIHGNSNSDAIVQENDSKNNDLNQSITQYDNAENTFKTNFSTSMNQISKPGLSNIVSAAAWYTTQLTSLFNASGSFQIIYVLPLVLGIALFFIGRGAVAFRQSSNSETNWVETIKDENGFTTRHGTIRSETVRGKGRYK